MECNRIYLNTPDSFLDTYFLDVSSNMPNSDLRPLVLVCPGGGYLYTSDREAEPIALAFAAKGFHAAVLRYPTAPARFPASLCSLADAMVWLKSHAKEHHVDPNKIVVSGFSAGGHLAASLGVFWNSDFLQAQTHYDAEMLRPDRLVLGYPVITSGEFAHRPSFENLLGENAPFDQLNLVSLEKQVSKSTPPTFLWHTCADEVVPVENSLLFAQALQRVGVDFELHVYSQGVHGLALSDYTTMDAEGRRVQMECTGWVDLACNWLRQAYPLKKSI